MSGRPLKPRLAAAQFVIARRAAVAPPAAPPAPAATPAALPPVATPPVDPAGWYGKLSMLGDFAQRRLPPEVVRVCDAWLARALTASRSQLGERWLDVYLRAPVLHFACAPGVLGGGWWFGVLMPSCDNVGRYFPLMIAQRRVEPPAHPQDLEHLRRWFDHLSRAAVDTLEDVASVEALERALGSAPAWPIATRSSRMAARLGAGDAPSEPIAAPGFAQALQTLGAHEVVARLEGCSVWWRRHGDAPAGAMSIVSGLPTGVAFVRLLTEA